MPTKTTLKLNVINPKSLFDTTIFAKSAFDRRIVSILENGTNVKKLEPISYIKNTLEVLQEDKNQTIELKLASVRTVLFYFVVLMGYSTEDPELMFLLQSQALGINYNYCDLLETAFKTDLGIVLRELDAIETFQSSERDCPAPNVLKENFIEGFKSKELKNWAKKLPNFDAYPPEDFDEEFDKELKEKYMNAAQDMEKILSLDEEKLAKLSNMSEEEFIKEMENNPDLVKLLVDESKTTKKSKKTKN
jgi:hypothetical protein